MSAANSYDTFMASKHIRPTVTGFDVKIADLNPILFDWQKKVVQWSLKLGRAALFEECGLGKTFQQMEWLNQVAKHTGRKVINLTPLAVAHQAISEAKKLGIDAKYCRTQAEADATDTQIIVTNYEMLGEFDASIYAGVSLDESSILKSFGGQTRNKIINTFAKTPYKLACTATPSPNDFMELGNHSEFLNIMPRTSMLAMYFTHDGGDTSLWRLKKHAQNTFWDWVVSWAACISKPSDIGYSDDGYDLKPINFYDHVVEVDHSRAYETGRLIIDGNLSATSVWKERSATTKDRCARMVDVIATNPDEKWVIWCDTNDESDTLKAALPYALEVKGSDSIATKESRLNAFSRGEAQAMITKPDIAGFGLNWQHCSNVGFVGVSYSFEKTYQALRRSWRFGQTKNVNAHFVYAESEGGIKKVFADKQIQHLEMQKQMRDAMHRIGFGESAPIKQYKPIVNMALPSFIK